MTTMHEEYGEPNDKVGKHLCCGECGYCITCGDCRKFGCGKGYKIKHKTKELWHHKIIGKEI